MATFWNARPTVPIPNPGKWWVYVSPAYRLWVVLGMASAANAVVAVPNDEYKAQADRHYDSDDNGSDVGFRCRW